MAPRHSMYDATFTKKVSEELVLSFDLTDWMDSGEYVASGPDAVAYNRETGLDVTTDTLDSSNDALDSDDTFWLYMQGGDDGDRLEIEIEWTTDADPAQNMKMVVLIHVDGP